MRMALAGSGIRAVGLRSTLGSRSGATGWAAGARPWRAAGRARAHAARRARAARNDRAARRARAARGGRGRPGRDAAGWRPGCGLRDRRPPGLGVGARGGFRGGRGGRTRQGRARMVGRRRAGLAGRGRGHLGHAAQDRPVVRVAQPHHALGADLDPVEPLQPEERPVGAAEVLDDPGAPVDPQLPVPPRDARVGHDDVGLRIPADAVGGPGLQLVNRAPGPHHEIGRGRSRAAAPPCGWRGLGEPGWREPGWGRTGLRRPDGQTSRNARVACLQSVGPLGVNGNRENHSG